jgi:hypothetical protein
MQAVMEHGGVPLYGSAIIVLEVVAGNSEGKGENFAIAMNGKHGLDYWRRELRVKTTKTAKSVLQQLAACGVIDSDILQENIVSVPMLREMLDNWGRRKRKVGGKQADEAQTQD